MAIFLVNIIKWFAGVDNRCFYNSILANIVALGHFLGRAARELVVGANHAKWVLHWLYALKAAARATRVVLVLLS